MLYIESIKIIVNSSWLIRCGNLKDKFQAINRMVKEFKRFVRIEPEVRPEYIEKLKKIQRGKHIRIGSIEDFRKRYGLK